MGVAPGDLAANGCEAASELPRPEDAGGLAAAFSVDMITGRKLESRANNISKFVR